MLFSKPKITALGFSLLSFSLAQLSDLSIFPPGGPGTILVTLNGHSVSTGCLNGQDLWTVKDAGASFEVTTTGTWSTADAAWLQAQIGTTGAASWGGTLWYADAQPDDITNVTLNGHAMTDSVQVTLTFNSTFVSS
ncbi:uncharacterized protein EAF01_001077 [Botrytis porri]|uniref:uncharacterized protein n=1 Tax=Botrytis porri TaxID=87229 RepID=UPI00190101AA|nr:uncharacterized protein EAF01_001077 [Botrytis porri]KAF7914671.1 hypothetical protein EAF01_001077 [Botrytis porri]